MQRKTRITFVSGIIEVEAAQDLNEKDNVTLSTYGKVIKHTKDSKSPMIGTASEKVEAGKMVTINMNKKIMPLAGEIWLNY